MATALKLNQRHTTQKRLGEGFLKVGATTISFLWNLQPLENFYYPHCLSPQVTQRLAGSQKSEHEVNYLTAITSFIHACLPEVTPFCGG